ncbi:hypothetical protein SFC55_19090 [Niallia taxi]|uniref:hypothetical protein n=1 Tax=Niallia TaxID=2837506 RepID=UPI0030F9DF97
MEIEIIQSIEKEQDWVIVDGEFEQFHISGDNVDYVEDTINLMQKAAITCFKYPFYIHFEGYDDGITSVLAKRDKLEIYYQNTGRKVHTMSNGKSYHAEIPAYSVTIPNYEALQTAFSEWFQLAQDNNMWMITQGSCVHYESKFASTNISQEPIILIPGHDAQELIFITNQPSYQKEDSLRVIFEE